MKIHACKEKYKNDKNIITIARLDIQPNHVIYEFDGDIYLTLLAAKKAEESPVLKFGKSSSLGKYFITYLDSIARNVASEDIYLDDVPGIKKDDELLNVVDKKDRLLSPASRSVIHRAVKNTNSVEDVGRDTDRIDLYPHRHVYCLVIHTHSKEPEVVLQKRSKLKSENPSMWDKTFGGHVLYGEGYEDACRRQIKSELGIVMKDASTLILLANSGSDFYTTTRIVEGGKRNERCHFRLYMYVLDTLSIQDPLEAFNLDVEEVESLKSIPLKEMERFVIDNEITYDLRYFVKTLGVVNKITKELSERRKLWKLHANSVE